MAGSEIPGSVWGGWRGWSGAGGSESELYLTLHCHHQNDFCINKTDSDESHFNSSFIVKGKKPQHKVHKPELFQEKGEPK